MYRMGWQRFVVLILVIVVGVQAESACGAFVGSNKVYLWPDSLFPKLLLQRMDVNVAGSELITEEHPLIDLALENFLRPANLVGIQKSLDRMGPYEGSMRNIFMKAGLPDNLIYLVVVESSARIRARSYAGAAGLWQLMPKTAMSLGLKVNSTVDERLDPIKSTWAVVRYLKHLYARFHSWDLVFAAYNMGENGLARRLKKYKTSSFFELCKRKAVPRQTRYYVPRVFAAIRIGSNPSLYGISLGRTLSVYATDTVAASGKVSLKDVSVFLEVPLAVLLKLNPAVKNPYGRLEKGTLIHVPWVARKRLLEVSEVLGQRRG